MTVQELIDLLNQVEDKNQPVAVWLNSTVPESKYGPGDRLSIVHVDDLTKEGFPCIDLCCQQYVKKAEERGEIINKTKDEIKYLALMKEQRLTLFGGKRKYLFLSFRLFRCLGKFRWFGLEFNRCPHGGNCDRYIDLTLFSRQLVIGIHHGTYDESVKTAG